MNLRGCHPHVSKYLSKKKLEKSYLKILFITIIVILR